MLTVMLTVVLIAMMVMVMVMHLNTWTKTGLREAQKSPAEACPCIWLQMMSKFITISMIMISAKRDFGSVKNMLSIIAHVSEL